MWIQNDIEYMVLQDGSDNKPIPLTAPTQRIEGYEWEGETWFELRAQLGGVERLWSWSFVAETRRHQKFPTSESRTFIMESSTDLLVHLTTSFAWVLYRMSIQVHIRLVLGSELSFPSSHLIHRAFQKLEASQLAWNKTKCESLSVYKNYTPKVR